MPQDIDTLIDRRRLKRRLTFWRIFGIAIAVALVAALVNRYTPYTSGPAGDYVARVSVDGMITENERKLETLRQVAKDNKAKALIVHINSPGGTTAGSEDLFHALRIVAAQKPVVAVMGTLAASGGYITAIAADHIVSRETTITGSIGVIFQFPEVSGLMKKVGVNMETVKSGPLKGQPAIDKPLSDKARVALQSMIDDSYDWFVSLVATRRNMPVAAVRELADGRAYTGRQALANGLVDELGGEREARQWLATEHQVSTDLPVVNVDRTARERLLEGLVDSFWSGTMGKMRLPLDGMIAVWHPDF